MTVEARFDLPPEEALKFFRAKGLAESFSWRDVWGSEHDAAFTVAKMADMDLLQATKDAIDNALSEGQTFAQFKQALEPQLMKAGWWGQKEETDPLTGRKQLVQLGSVRRLETIFRTNMMTAYAAGEWAQIQATKEDAPYLMYDAVDDNRTRPQHHAWDGTVLSVDDAWWQTHRPPNGYNCRCSVIQLSGPDLRALGKDGPDTAPPLKKREWVNKRTGEVMQIPVGIDPGFDYNPGASRQEHLGQLVVSKVGQVDARIGSLAAAQVAQHWVPSLRAAYSHWLDSVLAAKVSKNATHAIGVMAAEDVAALQAKGIEPGNAVVHVEDKLIVGKKARRHLASNDALSEIEWRALPDAIANPTGVLWDTVNKKLLYVVADPEGDKGMRLVVEPEFLVKGKQKINAVRSAFRVGINELKDTRRYELVRGLRE